MLDDVGFRFANGRALFVQLLGCWLVVTALLKVLDVSAVVTFFGKGFALSSASAFAIAWAAIVAEFGIGLAAVLSPTKMIALLGVLFGVFAFIHAFILSRGWSLDCPCFGAAPISLGIHLPASVMTIICVTISAICSVLALRSRSCPVLQQS
jgi:hypothetical protein